MAYETLPDRILMNGKGPYKDPVAKAHESFTVTKGKQIYKSFTNSTKQNLG